MLLATEWVCCLLNALYWEKAGARKGVESGLSVRYRTIFFLVPEMEDLFGWAMPG